MESDTESYLALHSPLFQTLATPQLGPTRCTLGLRLSLVDIVRGVQSMSKKGLAQGLHIDR
jgi:hypothetical protein